ncbi:unnamed protein product [Ilex paraguariensis]|uniref:Lipoamide acyltransferase component of branched-chain alpha-keto acid dehydrogenase complex, mitochondrial n=1 Tax=Ilex paraguariensis TaxID=185542 RepID=A0ABC8TKR9_9AQUA
MMYRRIYQKKPWSWSSCRRWWLCSYTTAASSPSTVVGGQRLPFLGFLSQDCVFRQASMSFLWVNDPNNVQYGLKKYCFSTQALVDLPVDGIVDVPLAQTGEGIAECELLQWFVQEGDHVEEFQPLCEVQSDKATIEITSRYTGKVSRVLHVPGDIVKVGETLLKIVVGESPLPTQILDALDHTKSLGSDMGDADCQSSVPRKSEIGGVLSTPAVRNLAKLYGININDVCGTGKDGRVLKEDILQFGSNKGILKETPVSSRATFPDQLLGGEGEYEDKAIPLRYIDINMKFQCIT